jgi:hypothetical protein
LGLIIGSCIVSASMLFDSGHGPYVFSMPLVSALLYGVATALGLVAFYNYIRK